MRAGPSWLDSIATAFATRRSSCSPTLESAETATRGRAQECGGAERIRVGVSACLLGAEVRFDGGHKRDTFIADTLARFVELVPVCPEVELGLGVPREAIRLERDGEAVRLIAEKSGADHTAAMRAYAERRADALAHEALCGYILKSNSPSCGMERVRVHGAHGPPSRSGRGLFAEALLARLPNLPVEEEGRLSDARRRENFIERIFAYHRLQTFFRARWTRGGLVAFHTAHKLELLAHSPRAYTGLGRMVAAMYDRDRADIREAYQAAFMMALSKPATTARHANVLQHIAGYFRRHLDPQGRRELTALIEDYRVGDVPLIAPITLVSHYARRFAIAYLEGQVYLEPAPRELMRLG